MARPGLGRGPLPAERPPGRVRRPRQGGCSADGHAYECYCTPEEVKARSDAGDEGGAAPGLRRRGVVTSPQPNGPTLAAEGRPRSIRFRTPDTGVSRSRPGARRGERRMVDDLGLRHRPLGRQPGVLPRQRGGRRRDGDHPRHPRRRPARHDAPGPRAPRGARVHRARPVRAPPAARRVRPGQARQASRFRGGRGLPRPRATSPTRWSTTSRCSAGRPPTGARCSPATRSSPSSTSTG